MASLRFQSSKIRCLWVQSVRTLCPVHQFISPSTYQAVLKRQEVLCYLPKGTDSYAYVGSMTVDEQYRRRGVAAAMLAQAEQTARAFLPAPCRGACLAEVHVVLNRRIRTAGTWRLSWIALHVYATNIAATNLYSKRGFRSVRTTQPFLGRARSLMLKSVS